MEYDDLVARIERERIRFLDIIDRIYSGDTYAVDDLDPEVFNERNKAIFLWNAQAMKGKKRYSGVDYYVHPASTAYLISLLVEPEDENRDTAIGDALTHELIDVALQYDADLFNQIVQSYSHKFRDELEAAIVLSPPVRFDSDRELAKVATVFQVKKTNNKALVYSLIADKLDNQLDLGYMDEFNREQRISHWFIAYPLFAVDELSGILPDSLVEKARVISEGTRIKYKIPKEMVQEYLHGFKATCSASQSELNNQMSAHYQSFGSKLR